MAVGAEELVIYSDSQQVVNQLIEEYEARDKQMHSYLSLVISLTKKFKGICIEHVARDQNSHADALTGLASACEASGPRSIFFRTIDKPSFELEVLAQEVMNISLGSSWMDEIVAYLKNDTLPPDKKEAHTLRCKAALYWLSPEGKLYRRSLPAPTF